MASSFAFDAHGIGLTGNLQRPERVWIPALAPVVLSPLGGYDRAVAEPYRLRDVLKCEYARCEISGGFYTFSAGVSYTELYIGIDGFNLLDVVAIEFMRVRLHVIQAQRSEPIVYSSGAMIRGLQVAGVPLRVKTVDRYRRARVRSFLQRLNWSIGPWYPFGLDGNRVAD